MCRADAKLIRINYIYSLTEKTFAVEKYFVSCWLMTQFKSLLLSDWLSEQIYFPINFGNTIVIVYITKELMNENCINIYY